jgi:DNA-binding LytR/AlgR family response regulator
VILASDFLIVEDEFLIAETISEILSNAGFLQVRIVSSVEEAITEIEIRKPDMVLTDINLGREKSGIDLGELLYKNYLIPFIYITSHSSPEILGKAKHTRPNAYIVKPFKNEDLIVAIELALFNAIKEEDNTTDFSELIVKEGRAIVRLNANDIKWMETDGNYTTINLVDTKRRVVRIPISELQQQLSVQQFVRIHKSYLVNIKHVTEVRANSVFIHDQELPVGRAFQASVSEFLK